MIEDQERKQGSQVSPKEFVFRYIRFLPWVALALLISLFGAWLKLRYTNPEYRVAGKLLVKDENPYNENSEKFSNLLMMPASNINLNNVMEILKSRAMAARVVNALGMQKRFYVKGNIRTSEAHQDEIPVAWEVMKVNDSTVWREISFKILDESKFLIEGETEPRAFGQIVEQGGMTFKIVPSSLGIKPTFFENTFIFVWQPLSNAAGELAGTLEAASIENTDVMLLSYTCGNIKVGTDIVNQYMREYQRASLEEKKQIAFNTLDFINIQLDTLQRDLGGVESSLQNFRERNQIFNPEAQSEASFEALKQSDKDLTEQGVKIQVLNYLRNYVASPDNNFKLVPSNLGIPEPTLAQQISEYNHLQTERATALNTTTAENPMIKNLDIAIAKTKRDILENLSNVSKAYELSYQTLVNKQVQANSQIRGLPGKEKQLLEVTRRQSILQELYSFLLQKKLETAISSASTISDIVVLEPALGSKTPVKPNRSGIYTIALFLGLALPISVIFLLDYFNDKISSKSDIAKVTDTPILGEVGHSDNAGALVVESNNRSFIAEQFRIIRSNLQFILPKDQKPVILVTSSYSGEGKSFVSTNLGAAMAISGKRTVILEMDIRKPKILKGLGMTERKGITNFIVSDINVAEIIYPVPGVDGMFVIPCGPVPPNPAEMLLNDRVTELFEQLQKQFDVVIIDSAPVGLVSDALTLSKYANAAIYIVRHDYTLKKQVHFLDDLYVDQKLPNMSIVINDVKASMGYGGYYGYGSNYGYGYGYGGRNVAQNSYFDRSSGKAPEKKGFKRWFS